MGIAEYSIKKKTITLILTLLLLGAGLIAYENLGRLEDPEFTIKDAKIITYYPGARPAEVEKEVTDVIETAIQQLGQLKEIESVSKAGVSIITPTIKDKYDKTTLPQVWDELRRKVADVQSQLPPGVKPSIVFDDFGDVYGILLAITGKGYSYRELKDYVDYLRRELLLVKGVAKVELWGEQQEAIYVEISRAKLASLGIPMSDIYATLKEQNVVTDAGSVRVGDEYISISPAGNINSVEDIGNLLIRGTDPNKLIYLRDVATITRSYKTPPTQIMRFDGQPALAIGISTVSGGNVVTMGEAVNKKLAELQKQTPAGMNIHVISFQGEAVTKAINGFVVNLLEAVVIVIIVLLIFMGMRSGLLIGAILFLNVLGTFIFMDIMDIALQRISLGALIIALGMLVDNAIVITDGILVRIQMGKDRFAAAYEVVDQNKWALLGATLIGILAFATISISKDATGEYTRSLFQVMFISLLLSWVLAVTVTPLFCTYILQVKKGKEVTDPYNRGFYRFYKGFVLWCIRLRWITMLLMVALLGLAIYGFSFLENSFFPDSTRPQFMVNYWRTQGSDIRATDRDIKKLEKYVKGLPGVDDVASFVGAGTLRFMLQYSPEDSNESYGQLIVNVKDYRDIKGRYLGEIDKYIKENFLNAEPKVEAFRMGTGSGALIQARFSGPDPAVLRKLAEQATTIFHNDLAAKHVRTNWRQRTKVIEPLFSEAKARRTGISRQDLSMALNSAFTGLQVGVYREGNKLIPIISRSPEAEHKDVKNINYTQIWSPVADKFIPLRQAVDGFVTRWEDPLIQRRDRKLTITAEADPAYGVANSLFTRLQPQIEAIKLPPGYELSWGGEYEDSNRAQAGIVKAIPFILVSMIVLTIILFNALRQPLIIWLCVPLSFIGVTAGLILTKQSFGFMALLGFLSLSGMLIKNAIVLIEQIDLEIREGKPPLQAILDSAASRMRPVSMAAVTTVLGMTPLLLDAFFIGMAVTIMFGLAFATLLTLVVVPVMYALFFRVSTN